MQSGCCRWIRSKISARFGSCKDKVYKNKLVLQNLSVISIPHAIGGFYLCVWGGGCLQSFPCSVSESIHGPLCRFGNTGSRTDKWVRNETIPLVIRRSLLAAIVPRISRQDLNNRRREHTDCCETHDNKATTRPCQPLLEICHYSGIIHINTGLCNYTVRVCVFVFECMYVCVRACVCMIVPMKRGNSDTILQCISILHWHEKFRNKIYWIFFRIFVKWKYYV